MRGPTRGSLATGAAAATVVAVLATPGWNSGARADTPAIRVALDAGACPAVSEADVRRILAVEVGGQLVDAGQATPADADRLTITCSDGRARIEARGSDAGEALVRNVRLGDYPGDAAPRALALTAIEVLAAVNRQRAQARADRRTPGTPAARANSGVPPAATATATATAAAPPARQAANGAPPRASALTLSAVRRDFLVSNGPSLWGGRLGADRELAAHWALGADVELDASGEREQPLGRARALLASVGAYAEVHGTGAWRSVGVALGGRFGLARLAGDPAPGAVGGRILRPWGGPTVATRWLATRGRLALRFDVEAGLTLVGVEGIVADGETLLSMRGAWVALSLGAGIRE
jgi:hypothetical protein